MTIYQISIRDEHGEHKGYNYTGSYPECQMEMHRLRKAWPHDGAQIDYAAHVLAPGKKGLLKLLNAVAGHPDNG